MSAHSKAVSGAIILITLGVLFLLDNLGRRGFWYYHLYLLAPDPHPYWDPDFFFDMGGVRLNPHHPAP